MPADVRLIAILDRSVLRGGRDPLAAARAAQAGGATILQLRMKLAPAAELFRLASELVAQLEIPVYVNDRADVAWAAGAAGVHLGADDVPAAAVRMLFPAPLAIGVSVGTSAEAEAVGAEPVDYWSIGSFYRTATKPDAGPPLGPSGFGELARLAPSGIPVAAIGGIDAGNAAAVVAAGAHGVAAIGAIFGADDIEGSTRSIRAAVDRALRERGRAGG